MEKISSLTPDQIAKLDTYRDIGLAVGLSTERVDFEAATAALKAVLDNKSISMPETVLYADGPSQGFELFKAQYPKSTHSDFINNIIYANHDSYFLYYYKYFHDVVGIDLSPILPMCQLAEVSGWCYIDTELAIVHDRPNVIKFDDRNLAHCENGPAISYLDGTEVYMWHGVRVNKHWIVDRTLTAKQALAVENTELRRAACEILGWVNVLKELNSVVIDEDADPQVGTLLEVDIPDIGKEKFLQVLCGTGRTFCLPVPPDMQTALAANAWTFGIEPWEYTPEVRT